MERKSRFHYYTMDRRDPALTIDNEYMHSKYIGEGMRAYKFFARINHPILLTTTPNIGEPGFPLQRPSNVQKLIHIFHSVADISMYRRHALDSYDAVYLAGEFQSASIREIEEKRDLPHKELSLVGLPYLDTYAAEATTKFPAAQSETTKRNKTVLVASSWGKKGCLVHYGPDFIKAIAEKGFLIIIRPHPQSYISEPDLIKHLKRTFRKNSNITWDDETSPVSSILQADILVSDTSSIRFDYAFLTGKPVITLAIQPEEMTEYEYSDLLTKDTLATLTHKIGDVLAPAEIKQLSDLIEKRIGEKRNSEIKTLRNQTICHFGQSGAVAAEHLIREIHAVNESSRAAFPATQAEVQKLQHQIECIMADLNQIKETLQVAPHR